MDNYCVVTVFHKIEKNIRGNTAAVLETTELLDTATCARLAEEFNQPATSFIREEKPGHYSVCWFAPDSEINLCGHGSLAIAAYLKEVKGEEKAILHYDGGVIKLGWDKDAYFIWIDPIDVIEHKNPPAGLSEALGTDIVDYFTTSNKDIVLLKTEEILKNLKPNFAALAKLEPFGYAVSAPGDYCDFVSRTFVPKVKQLEDHATGSSHAILAPFWSDRLMKDNLRAYQLSPRGGYFICEMHLNKVLLKGQAKIWARGSAAFKFEL
jgi:predicted PhzF superfamily epimerase YddE/YHI9